MDKSALALSCAALPKRILSNNGLNQTIMEVAEFRARSSQASLTKLMKKLRSDKSMVKRCTAQVGKLKYVSYLVLK